MLVKASQHAGDGVQYDLDGLVGLAACDHGRQPVVVAIPPHDDDRFGGTSGGVVEMRDPEIAARRQTAVQLDFP